MENRNFWLRTLNVRSNEGALVKKLFLLEFFQGAGIAFFFTAAFALFLAKFPITELPYVFIYSSLLLWITGFIYSKIEHKFHISQLAIFITIFMVASMLIFRLAYGFIKAEWFLYWMLAWFNVLYLLNNLEFWGIASLLFDARQSKRLFGVISAGDIPAKFIGYSLAVLTVEFFGTINLIWFGIVSMLISIPFLVSIKKTAFLLEVKHHTHHAANTHTHDVSKIVKNVSGNILIRRLAVLSILVTGSFLILNFAFYAGVKEAYQDDVSLAKFIAFFLAIVRIVAMIIKMIFTGRLMNNLGITRSLLITPVVMFLMIATIVLTQNMDGYQKIIIYLFGITSIIVDILRSSINTPVFLTIMQPLSNHERLRAHTIVKGIMDPFASLFAGVIILILVYYNHHVNLLELSYLLMAISIFWIIGIFRVNNQYLKTVIKTISSRYFNQENFVIKDSNTLEWLKNKVSTGTEIEVINILNMLYSGKKPMKEELVTAVLEHPSDKVKMAALTLLSQKDFPTAAQTLKPLLTLQNDPLIVAETIKIMCHNGVDNNLVLPYCEHLHKDIRKAALAGLLYHGNAESKAKTRVILQQMKLDENPQERRMVAEVLSIEQNSWNVAIVQNLMNDSNAGVRKAAFLAAGKSGNKMLIQDLMHRLHKDENAIIQALYAAGEFAIPFITAYITKHTTTKLQKEKLILLCGRLEGNEAKKNLLGLLATQPEDYITVIKAMYRGNYNVRPADRPIFISTAKKILSRCAGIIYMQNSLQSKHEKYQLLINSFNLELVALRDGLLYLFALIYDRENINKVRIAYAAGKKDNIINAMEIIDLAVRKDLASHFNTIFEPGNIADRMHGLRKIYPVEFFEDVENVLTHILTDEVRPYNNWTTACCLYTSKKQHHDIDNLLIKKYTADEDMMVRETALFAL